MKAVVRDVMSTHPISVPKTASFKEIAARLHEYRVSAFPVLDDDGTVVGVVSEADMVTVRDRLAYPFPPVPVTPGPYF